MSFNLKLFPKVEITYLKNSRFFFIISYVFEPVKCIV